MQGRPVSWASPGGGRLTGSWGLMVPLLTIAEAFVGLMKADFQLPTGGHSAWFGFFAALFAVLCVAEVTVFTVGAGALAGTVPVVVVPLPCDFVGRSGVGNGLVLQATAKQKEMSAAHIMIVSWSTSKVEGRS